MNRDAIGNESKNEDDNHDDVISIIEPCFEFGKGCCRGHKRTNIRRVDLRIISSVINRCIFILAWEGYDCSWNCVHDMISQLYCLWLNRIAFGYCLWRRYELFLKHHWTCSNEKKVKDGIGKNHWIRNRSIHPVVLYCVVNTVRWVLKDIHR